MILALSITKWIHLNWGDDGLKRFFKRVYKNLRRGGHFILEAQAFETYNKRSRINVKIFLTCFLIFLENLVRNERKFYENSFISR